MDAANKPSPTFSALSAKDPQAGPLPHEKRATAASGQKDALARLQELQQRDDLSGVITAIVTDILSAVVIKEALPRALDTLSAHIRFDRMVVIEVPENENPKVVFAWSPPGMSDGVDMGKLILKRADDPQVCEWVRPLRQGKPVFAARGVVIGSMREFLTEAGVSAVLLVPVMVGGHFWGQIGFDDRDNGERWKPRETAALKTFADFLGVALTRERFLGDVHQRDKLLQTVTQSAAAIVTSPYLHEAISHSLEMVAQTLDADRMYVLEIVPGAGGQEQCLLRNNWQRDEVSPELNTLLRPMSEFYAAAVAEWMAPLRNNCAIQGHIRQASDGLRDYFERLNLLSTLIVPIMLDGKYWGRIGFDDCTNERKWTETEIGILKTLADLIGTAIMRERYVEELGKANTIIQNSPTILFRLRGEPSFPMIYVSQNISLFGFGPEELLNSPTLYQSYIHPGDRTKVQSTMAEMLRRNAAARTIENRMLISSGESRWVETRYTPVRDTNGRLIEVEGIMIDITERKAAEEKIALLARTDPLTGLANRATFSDRLRQALAAMKRGTAPFAVLYLDLDRFKEINDTLGHPMGDKLLQAVAGRLLAATRKTDLVARLGGDEFSILQGDTADSSDPCTLAGKLIEEVSAPYQIDGSELRIGVSIGISLASVDVDDPEVFMGHADKALYRAKEEGRGQYRFYSGELDEEARRRAVLTADLKLALERNELELYYEPRVDLVSGLSVGVEAMLRWNHPQHGTLSSDVFMPIAEKSGVMQAVGRFLLDGACRKMAQWRREKADIPVVAMAVTLNQTKRGREFVQMVKESLERWGLQPSDIELDVTELVLARTTLSQSSVLEELQRLGVGIAIDDFGAEYSSLDYLKTYRVGRLKIAKSMLVSAAGNKSDLAMVRGIVRLARELGVAVVGEDDDCRQIVNEIAGKSDYLDQPVA